MYVRTLHHSLIDEEQLHRHVHEVGLLGGVWGLPTDMLHCAWNLWNRSIASLLNNLDMSQTGRKIKRYSSTTLRRSCFRKPWLFLLASLPCLWIITTWTSAVLNYVDRYKIQWFEGTIETESIFGYLPLPQGQHSMNYSTGYSNDYQESCVTADQVQAAEADLGQTPGCEGLQGWKVGNLAGCWHIGLSSLVPAQKYETGIVFAPAGYCQNEKPRHWFIALDQYTFAVMPFTPRNGAIDIVGGDWQIVRGEGLRGVQYLNGKPDLKCNGGRFANTLQRSSANQICEKKDPGDNGIRDEDSNTRQHSSANQICEKKSRLTRGSAAKSSRT